jgi:flagellar protein FliS
MNQAAAYNQYRQTAVQTSPEKLLLMLLDGAIKFLHRAMIAIDQKDVEGRHNNLIKTQDIIQELIITLNMDYEISNNLLALYQYFTRRLAEANVSSDKEVVEEILGMISEMKNTWAEAAKLTKASSNVGSSVNVDG